MIQSESRILLSPSKVSHLGWYLYSYPSFPLHLDVLMDLVLYAHLGMQQFGEGIIFSIHDIERGPWKKAFEDLVNSGSIEPHGENLTRDESTNFLRFCLSRRGREVPESVRDIAIFAIYAARFGLPLVHSRDELSLLESASNIRIEIGEDKEDAVRSANDLDLRERADWLFKLQIPTMFTRKPKTATNEGFSFGRQSIPVEKSIWVDPGELVSILSDRVGLMQLREKLESLSEIAQSQDELTASVHAEIRNFKREINIGGLAFKGLDLILLAAPGFVSTLVNWVFKPVLEKEISRPYRWLLMTERIEANLYEAKD
jgi:hypothetical protein